MRRNSAMGSSWRSTRKSTQGYTSLSPLELLAAIQSIERDLGRRRGERWGPRPLDVDILDYDGAVINLPGLIVPHREIARREFVLLPWSRISPGYRVPGLGRTVTELRESLREGGAGPGRVLRERNLTDRPVE